MSHDTRFDLNITAPRTSVCLTRQDGVFGGVMQGVIQSGDHTRRVAKSRVCRKVLDPLPVYPNVARVT